VQPSPILFSDSVGLRVESEPVAHIGLNAALHERDGIHRAIRRLPEVLSRRGLEETAHQVGHGRDRAQAGEILRVGRLGIGAKDRVTQFTTAGMDGPRVVCGGFPTVAERDDQLAGIRAWLLAQGALPAGAGNDGVLNIGQATRLSDAETIKAFKIQLR